jgi:phosphomevalonate kinase
LIARAPGKLVLSGAYVVLDGAPAVVASVDRWAIADTSRPAAFVGPELAAVFPAGGAPYIDTSAMRIAGRKIGIGSSSALVVAAIAATRWAASGVVSTDEERRTIAALALAAHRAAQGGGSGIDVLASTHGGVLVCEVRGGEAPQHRSVRLPAGLVIEAWVCPASAQTSALLGPVRELAARDPARYADVVREAREGADLVARGLEVGNSIDVIRGAAAQRRSMRALAAAADVPILPTYLATLGDVAQHEGVFAQAGAGGGDVALFFGRASSSPTVRREAHARGMSLLPLSVGVAGVEPIPSILHSPYTLRAPT